MCDVCTDFLQLLVSYESQISNDSDEQHRLSKQDIAILLLYVQSWPARQCMCCFRDIKNLDRFALLTQGVIYLCVIHLKDLRLSLSEASKTKSDSNDEKKEVEKDDCDFSEIMSLQDKEKLFHLVSKIFLMNFPLYLAYKHTVQSKLEDITSLELTSLNLYCDLHDQEIPIYLLRNVSLFCKVGGIHAMTLVFQHLQPDCLPVSTAHAIIAIVCNLKLWLNFKTTLAMLVPLRSRVLRYMCRLADTELRTPSIKSMADFMWSAIKDPLEMPQGLDSDGLDLAFKYFTSSTLTMRLAGIAQINSHIGLLAELCGGVQSSDAAETAPRCMADWLTNNNIIAHIFGPNLHVEVIKQSHIILNFLAMEGRITCEHIDIMWAAAQLKHCSKPVHDLLPGLIKHLSAGPALHLYGLLVRLEPREHTEQTLYLASALIKFIWTRGGGAVTGANNATEPSLIGLAASAAGIALHKCPASSSENSVSIDGSNSDEEQGESSVQSESHKSVSEEDDEEEEGEEEDEEAVVDSEGPTPCKQPRTAQNSEQNSHDDSVTEGIKDEENSEKKPPLLSKSNEKQSSSARKKLLPESHSSRQTNETTSSLPEGVEPIASSSSIDEDDFPLQDRCSQRRRVLRKKHSHKKKCNRNIVRSRSLGRTRGVAILSDPDADSDVEAKHIHHLPRAKSRTSMRGPMVSVYLGDSSSGSESGKPFIGPLSSHDSPCQSFIPELDPRRAEQLLELLSGDEVEGDADGSYSSRMSNKSEKNMGDFDGEESGCEEELAHLTAQGQLASQCLTLQQHGIEKSPPRPDPRLSACFKIDNVCQPGNTLLWDLLQDNKIGQLGEGLALEAEKALCNLLCYSTDRIIRMKFIEGCLQNLANNWSVVISLRLLPKLLASFQQFRGLDTSHVTHWADKQHHMMAHFFNNLRVYTGSRRSQNTSGNTSNTSTCSSGAQSTHSNLYTHQMQVQVRLHFLSAVYSPLGSPKTFKLSVEQVDTLWQCLAHDNECSDELFSWLLSQAKSGEQHALGADALKRLYLTHLPALSPEQLSPTALALFQQLCNLARSTSAHSSVTHHGELVGMGYLWKVALRANNTDVSMAAIQYLNNYYLSQRLQHEADFVSQCMTHLAAATKDLEPPSVSEDAPLLRIQRALLLLKTHLDTFRRRYSYHLRRWSIDGKGIGSHGALGERPGAPLRVMIQLAGMSERTPLDLLTTDFVAELRAEAAHVWETVHAKPASETEGNGVLGSLLHDGPIRMITQGQELTTDFDEKTLQEIGFKENQMVFISMGVNRGSTRKRDSSEPPSLQQAPPREAVPMLLLLRPACFEQLFELMHTLSAMRTRVKGGNDMPHTKAQVLSRRVWDILTMLPTNPTLLSGFQRLDTPLSELLNPSSPQKLMYSLHIVEALAARRSSSQRASVSEISTSLSSPPHWSTVFAQNGGLRHLFDIFMSGILQHSADDNSEWQQDCLASLLKLLSQLGVHNQDTHTRSRCEKLLIPALNEAMLVMMDVQSTMARLMSILHESSLPRDPNHYKTGFWGRAQVVHYAMALLVSWLHCSEEARQMLFQALHFELTLQRLVLEEPEPSVRREVCAALYRLCLGSTTQGDTGAGLAAPMLSRLLIHLPKAESMRPQKQETMHHPEEGKEPYGPACRDYFWLVCRLVDGLPDDIVRESLDEPSNGQIDINELCKRVSDSILAREFLEVRHRTVEDDGLIGLLNLMGNLIKHKPPFQTSKEGKDLLLEVFDFLFALPTPRLRHVPKCKSSGARTAAFDLLVELVKGAPENYAILHEKLLIQHRPGPHSPYPWDYWPHDDGRSECGYVGLTNLGATCYMASCMQHLYMMPQARSAILAADCNISKHEATLRELQRMFAYLLESERKAYNPRSFCKVYTMDHQPLNTGEQKDMAEFFIDLVSKLEEMNSQLKSVVKTLFCGVLSNNVVSLDCDHVSRTLEEFYTVRCQVADMRNLYESLDEVTVKDTLEGDNMYTCSHCGKKVRAEKRACFKKLPHILCFNTMRYTFNMATMQKEKVNTHFSFPLRLNMAGYVEKQLMPQHYQEERQKQDPSVEPEPEHYEYDLIGVTVHTGTADGGHYYSFIKDRGAGARDKWLLFNDAEVKPFDPNQIAAECFGGEMTSKTYDSVTDKFMDFSFEKTNSAYMLFYEYSQGHLNEECPPSTALGYSTSLSENHSLDSGSSHLELDSSPAGNDCHISVELSKELEDWIWKDNMHFIQDKNIFEHTYFNFMWQICGYIPQTLLPIQQDITQHAAQLSTSFFIETFIHAKEKPTMVQWVELVTKQFNACQQACEWFLEHMASDTWWPVQVLIKCPNQMVRQMFQRLCIHVIQRLRQSQASLYLLTDDDDSEKDDDSDETSEVDPEKIGNRSCVTKFIKSLLSLMEHGAKAHLKHLTEYFGFLYEFCRMGDEETRFLISVRAIHMMVHFYLGHNVHDFVDVSDGDDEEEVAALPTDKYKPASLDKMIALIAMLVERSRGPDLQLELSTQDYNALAGGKGFPFLYQQIKDNINLQQTRNLIHSLCRGHERLATLLVNMLSQAISRHPESCQPFFKLLTLLTEGGSNTVSMAAGSANSGGPSGLPCFTQLVLQRVWEAAECCPHSALEWLSLQVARSKLVHQWVLQSIDTWVEHFLIAHSNQRVRSAAAFLLVSLVPSSNFRQGYRSRGGRGEALLTPEAQVVLHQVYTSLLRLLGAAKHYTDIQTHGTTKLTAYFALLTYCVVSRTEKLMFGQHFMALWHLFHPKLSEPSVPAHHNKQALLVFWHHVCTDCPENVQLILHNAHVTKNIAFNYILADHDDQEVVMFNRAMLPAYYGLLRLCCLQSRTFTRHLASHQNLQWAFKNITPHPTQYTTAVDELFKLMQLFVTKHPDSTEQDIREINAFRRSTLSAYLQCLDGRTGWATVITAFRVLIDSDDDRLYIVYNGGLQLVFESLVTLHVMYHEATACQVSGELLELLALCLELVRCFRQSRSGTGDVAGNRALLFSCKDWLDALRKLATLLNTYNPAEMRSLCIDILKELVLLAPGEALQVLVPLLSHCHAAFQDTHNAVPLGPYYPRRGVNPPTSTIKAARPLRPMVQMAVPHNQLELTKGSDPEYDQMLQQFYAPYHEFIDVLCRVAVNNDCLSEVMVTLSAMVGFEAVPLHSTFFPKLWLDILRSQHVDRKYVTMLTSCNYFVDYVDAVLLDERSALTVNIIFEFMTAYFSKVASHVLTDQTCNLIDSLVSSLAETVNSVDVRVGALRLSGDLRALLLVYSAAPQLLESQGARLVAPLQTLNEKIKTELLNFEEDGTTPTKKRKVAIADEDKSTESNLVDQKEPKASCSHDCDNLQTDLDQNDKNVNKTADSPKLSIDNVNTPKKSKPVECTTVNKLSDNESKDKKDLEDISDNTEDEFSPEKATLCKKIQTNSVIYNLKLLESVIKELIVLLEKIDCL